MTRFEVAHGDSHWHIGVYNFAPRQADRLDLPAIYINSAPNSACAEVPDIITQHGVESRQRYHPGDVSDTRFDQKDSLQDKRKATSIALRVILEAATAQTALVLSTRWSVLIRRFQTII
ncbi:hypothetical protein A0H81_01803 [Grifola frondosa]|uniref:Uncharacterized protein n=1 Tax=Grifola frondosa TaxID=5627 RepID=A0A1C7MM27_GRIFR|nr:hypothetical protein A0H81_01803 [Grifola frondosa]